MLRMIAGTVAALALLVPPAAHAQDDPCAKAKAGEHCGPGNGRKTSGGTGTGKVSHSGWPAITGVLWYVEDGHGHTFTGGSDNDELLGLHGNDTLNGAGGNDVIWGDQANNNPANQSDVLYGGARD